MIQKALFIISIYCLCPFCRAQKIGQIKDLNLTLVDIAVSGDDIQPHFRNTVTGELHSFSITDWLDKHVLLTEFYRRYKDSCREFSFEFDVTLIYIPMEQFKYVRFEGFTSTGEIKNQWVLTSIIQHKPDSETSEMNRENAFTVEVSKVEGDLNDDDLLDLAIVTQDTTAENAPYLLEIFFRQANGDLTKIVSTTKAIDPQFPDGRENPYWNGGFDQLSIRKGVLWIQVVFTRGHMEHKFRFQHEKFELIGYCYVDVTAGQIERIDYNLSTGRRIEKSGTISSDKNTVVKDEIIKLDPLPDLETFQPYVNELY